MTGAGHATKIACDQEQDDKELTEDDCNQAKEEVQKLVKKFEDKANELAKAKESEVMNE